jgi:hypothetical protein
MSQAILSERKSEMETASKFPGKGGKAYGENNVCSAERNIWCPEYDKCLWDAALADLPLDCTQCPLQNIRIGTFVLTGLEIEGCKALVRAIFYQEPPIGFS